MHPDSFPADHQGDKIPRHYYLPEQPYYPPSSAVSPESVVGKVQNAVRLLELLGYTVIPPSEDKPK